VIAMTDTRDQFHERESQVAPPVRSGEISDCDEAPIGAADIAIVSVQRIARAAISKATGAAS
jgi:hypothetical protein